MQKISKIHSMLEIFNKHFTLLGSRVVNRVKKKKKKKQGTNGEVFFILICNMLLSVTCCSAC